MSVHFRGVSHGGWRGITGQGWVTVWYGRDGWRTPNGRSLHLWGNIYRRSFNHVVHDAVTMGGSTRVIVERRTNREWKRL